MTRRLLSIATLYPAPHRPGFGRFVARQMEALAARGDWEVMVINPVGVPPLRLASHAALFDIPAREQNGPIVIHHPRFTLMPGLSGRFNPALIARKVLPLARRLHAQRPFDLVDAQFFYPDGPAAARIAAALGLPLAIKARGSDIHVWGQRASPLRQMRAAADQAAAVLAVSDALARDMTALGMAAQGISVHRTGLDRALFRPLPRSEARALLAGRPELAGLAPGPLLVSVASLVPIKGHALAIRALAHLPRGTTLMLVGTGPEEAALRALTASENLTGRVRFLGDTVHELVPTLLSAADVMVLPSEREGLANAWIEALACGTPIVIPDVGGAREVVTSAAAGRIAARNPAAIAAAVADLLAHPSPQDDVAACAAEYSWNANAEALAAIYEAAITAKTR